MLFEVDEKLLQQQAKIEVITDGLGLSIKIPAHGSLTWQEAQQYDQLLMERGVANSSMTTTEFKLKCIEILLKSRCDVPKEATFGDLFVINGNPISDAMLEKLYSFFKCERKRGEPDFDLLTAVGKDAKSVCFDYARKQKAVVICNLFSEEQSAFYVVKNSYQLNEKEGWTVVASFEEHNSNGKSKSVEPAEAKK